MILCYDIINDKLRVITCFLEKISPNGFSKSKKGLLNA